LHNGTAVNLDLVINSFYRQFTDQIALTDQASKLPALLGSGHVRDLPEAISRSPELGRFVESYLRVSTRQGQIDMLDDFLEKWAETSNMKSLKAQAEVLAGNEVKLVYSLEGLSSGTSDYDDFVSKLGIVERFMGFTYGGPTGAVRFTPLLANSGVTSVSLTRPQIESISMAYDMFKNDLYQSLLFQSRLQGYVSNIVVSFSNGKILLDAAAIESSFKKAINANPQEGIIDLIEFICVAGASRLSSLNWNAFDFLLAELNNASDFEAFSGDLDDLYVRFAGPTENNSYGSSRADLLVGTLSFDTLFGGAGNDIIHGKSGNDFLNGDDGEDTLLGASGNDTLDGASGNDIIDGGDGNDLITDHSGNNTLRGGAGNDTIRSRGTFAGGSGDDLLQASDVWFGDTYLFQIGDGKDVINDLGYMGTDAISFGAGISPSELPLHRVGQDLRFLINANDHLSVKDWFSSSHQYIEQIRFANSTTWNVETILSTPIISAGSANADNLIGWQGIDSLIGGGGNDTLDGASGNDIIDGGDGNDLITDNSGNNTLRGGAGNDTILSRGIFAGGSDDDLLQASDVWFGDTYLFQIGDGKDVINDLGYMGTDAISFGAGISPSELPLHRVGQDLRFLINANDHLSVKDWFSSSHQYIEQIRFANSTTWNVDSILSTPIISAGSANADNLIGWQGIDSLIGGGGNDTLDGASGNDIIDGGDGNDLITDNSGNNTLRGGAGNDTILSRGIFAGGSGDDLMQASDVWFGDTYLFQIGDGKDVINDLGYMGTDAISFGAGISPSELPLHRVGQDLRFLINANDHLSVKDWFSSSHQYIEQIRFANSTTWNVDTILSTPIISAGSANADNLIGWQGIDSLIGGGGNDTLDGASGNDIIDGGDGNDLITDNSGNNTLRGGAGNDTILSRGIFAGGSGDDLMQASDVWFGDTYLFQIGDGKDVINDLGYMGSDAISFGAGISPSELPLHRVGQDLRFLINANDHISVKDWFSSRHQYIEQIRFANGTTWNVDSILSTPIVSVGSANADNLIGWQGIDSLIGGGGNDTLDGASGNDIIDGGDGNDLITDNSGNNTLRGGAGNDTILSRGIFAGGSGDDLMQASDVWFGDTYLFQIGDGKDVINDLGYMGSDAISFGAGISPSELPLHRVGQDLRFLINANDHISVKDWFSSRHQYIEQIRFANGTTWNVDSILSTPIVSVGSANADNLIGWQGIDSLIGGSGNDTLDGAAGNDILEGGDGNDLLIDYTGINSLRGGAGNDTIRSRGTFVGGSGDDLLQSSDVWFGDTYLFQIGDGMDVINDLGYSGIDSIIFGAGINADMLWLKKSATDLDVTIIGSTEGVKIKNWYTSSYQQIERFQFGDGKVLPITNVDALVSAMAAFSPSSIGHTSLSGTISALHIW
jgi:Ca2+-binding RTX toxin-like protein